MRLFRTLLVLDLAIAAVLGLIFWIGLADALAEEHVDREDLLLWPPLILGVGAVLGGGLWLKSRRRVRAANGVLLLVAVPGVVAGLLVLALLVAMSRPGAFR